MSRPSHRKRSGEFRLGFLIHDVSRLRRTLFDREMRPLGVTHAQWWTLAQLSRGGSAGMAQAELARLLGLGKVAVSGMVERLEAAGLVERRPDPANGRIKRVLMTPRGRETIDRMRRIGRAVNAAVFDGLTSEQIATTEHALATLRRNITRALGNGDGHDDDAHGPA